jgi:uncharacterized ubiquitin-like protein YukD
MKKIFIITASFFILQTGSAQIIDWDKLDLKSLLGNVMNVKQGWAPKFKIGNLDVKKIAKVGEIINLKNIDKATKLFNTFKTGRTIYKAGAYAGLAASTYSTVKNLIESNKEAVTAEAKKLKSEAIQKAQKFMIVGGSTLLTGVLIKFLTKQAASKAADAFNGTVRKKIQDILSIDTPSPSPFTQGGVALKIKLL